MKAPRSIRSLPLVALVFVALGSATLAVWGQVASPAPQVQSQTVVISKSATGPSGRPVRRSEVGFKVDGLQLVTYPAAGQTAKQTADALAAQLGAIYKGTVTKLAADQYELRVETRVPTLVALRLSAPLSTDRTQTIKLAAAKPQAKRQGLGVELRLDAAVYDRPPIVIPSPNPFPSPILSPPSLHRPLKIKAVFTVWNATAEPFEVVSGGQRYEFILRDAQGREQWRWSTGRAFPRLIAQRILNLTSGEWVFAEDLEITDPGNHGLAPQPGEYALEARLMRDNGPQPQATVGFKVR